MQVVLKWLRDSSLFFGSAVYLRSNILAAAIPFILLPVLTHYLSPAEYGKVGMFLMLVVLLVVLIKIFGLTGAAVAFSILMALRFLLAWGFFHKHHPMPWFQVPRLKVANNRS
jgi:O-antigen/teichoic acid export membrane protein